MSLIGIPSRNHLRHLASRTTWLGLAVLASLAGCGEDATPDPGTFYPVNGKILLHDGKPLTSGGIEFMASKGPLVTAAGTIGPDGSFTLTTNGREGAPATDYRVKLVPDPAKVYVTRGNTRILDARKVPYSAKYLDEEASELNVTIKPQPNELEPITLSNRSGTYTAGRSRARN